MTPRTAPLTPQQLACLRRKALGRTNAQIAADLVLPERAVMHELERVFRALGAVSSAHAVHLAHLSGLLGAHRPRRHGDHAGYVQHVRRGEDPKACPLGCHAAELAYQARRRAARITAKEKADA